MVPVQHVTVVIWHNIFTIMFTLNSDTPSQLQQLLKQRISLDRRRLEEAFLLYASLEIISKHNLWAQLPTLPFDRNEILQQITAKFNKAFMEKWGGKYCLTNS